MFVCQRDRSFYLSYDEIMLVCRGARTLPPKPCQKTFKIQGGALEIFFVAKILFKLRVLRSVTFGHQNHQFGVAFGDIWPTSGHPFGPSGPPGSDLATESIFGHSPGGIATPFGVLLAPKITKFAKIV